MIEIRRQHAGDPPGSELLAEMVATLDELYGAVQQHAAPTAPPDEMWSPHGTFLVLWDGGDPVACGGLRRLGDSTAEIKRMFVRPRSRSRGHARRILVALEAAARELGYAAVRLDTGPRQPHARSLYESAGYGAIPDYNGNPRAAYWFEKPL